MSEKARVITAWEAMIVAAVLKITKGRLAPHGEELKLRHIWQDIKDHARLQFPAGAAALKYNILQKLSYPFVLFLLLPTIVLTGLTMSPSLDAASPWLLDLFGGRQSARSWYAGI